MKIHSRLKPDAELFYDEHAEYYHVARTSGKDLIPIDIGRMDCASNKPPVAQKFPYYLLHYVYKGRGSLRIFGNTLKIKSGTFFLIPPDTDVEHFQDRCDPWSYYWINFNGIEAKRLVALVGLDDECPVYKMNNAKIKRYYEHALSAKNRPASQNYAALCCLYGLFELLAEARHIEGREHTSTQTQYAEILDFISSHLFDRALTPSVVAAKFFISLSYFSRMFKKNAGSNFAKYVNYERVKKATELLIATDMPIKSVAATVGFNDPLYFSKVFKAFRLVSPEEYRLSVGKQEQT